MTKIILNKLDRIFWLTPVGLPTLPPKILFLNRCLYLILFYREQLCRIERQVIHSVDTYILILRFIEFFPENVIWIFNQKPCIVQKVTLL